MSADNPEVLAARLVSRRDRLAVWHVGCCWGYLTQRCPWCDGRVERVLRRCVNCGSEYIVSK